MFSVIIPAYNAAGFIKKTIESVLNQKEQNFEILVIDDGSTDATSSVVKSIEDERIHYIYQENAGVSVARNTGILSSKGEFICFLDADDWWKSNHLETLNKLILDYKNANVFITGHEVWLRDGSIIEKSKIRLKEIKKESFYSENAFETILKHGYFFHTNSMCCERGVFEKVGLFEPGVKNGEDDDMWYRMFAKYSVAIAMEVTTCYSRQNCIATAQRTRNLDWIFLSRLESIYSDITIPKNRKESLERLMERRKVSDIRYLILSGRKREAIKLFFDLDFRAHKKGRVLFTFIALIVPTKIIKIYIDRRDKEYY